MEFHKEVLWILSHKMVFILIFMWHIHLRNTIILFKYSNVLWFTNTFIYIFSFDSCSNPWLSLDSFTKWETEAQNGKKKSLTDITKLGRCWAGTSCVIKLNMKKVRNIKTECRKQVNSYVLILIEPKWLSRPGIIKLWLIGQLSGFVNNILLEHRHAHLFIESLCLLLCYKLYYNHRTEWLQ